MDIVAFLPCLRPPVTTTTHRRWRRSILAWLGIPGRLTMLGRSRWAGKGGSYRPVQRLCSPVLPWAMLLWGCFRHPGPCPAEPSGIAGEAVLVTTAGPPTQGLERGFSSWYGQPVPGLAVFPLSRVSGQQRRSCPRRLEQGVRRDAATAARQANAAATPATGAQTTRRPGRPQGSKPPPSGRPAPPGPGAEHREAPRLAPPDRPRTHGDLPGAGGALWPPPRPAEGAPGRLTPHVDAAGRGGAVLPLSWALCGARSPSHVWPHGG